MSEKLSYNPSDFVCSITIEEKLRRVPEDAEWWVHQWSTSDYFDIGSICFEALAKLNAQKSEINSLHYENSMLKNRHHLQQAEIEALKKELALWRLSKSSEEIESIPSESDKFCDTHCVWTDHHPECKHAKYRR